MLKFSKEETGTTLNGTFDGNLDESVDLDTLIGAPRPEMRLNCKEIKRVNSTGVKAWVRYFKEAAQRGSKVTLTECSPAMVEQINLIMNFTSGAKIESIYVPFACEKCHTEHSGLFKTEDLRTSGLEIAPIQCSKCDGQAVFDDLPEEYFAFIKRR